LPKITNILIRRLIAITQLAGNWGRRVESFVTSLIIINAYVLSSEKVMVVELRQA
jgi:hypothetical protein